MAYMTKNQYDFKLEKIQKKNEDIEYRRKLRKEKRKYWPKFKLPSTSKIVLLVAALLCVEILVFCQYMILTTGDTNALYAMVGALVSFVPIILGYYVKSMKENTRDGITFETAMAQIKMPQAVDVNEEAVG